MLGHAQIEGFTEKYGMEYRKAYWEEQADPYLVERHEKEIFPLLRKRALFAEAAAFRLFDFFTPEGAVDEDVFAYTNRRGSDHSLVVYQNRFKSTRGWLNASCAFPLKAGDEKQMIQENLAYSLSLPEDPDAYLIMKEQHTGQEYLFPCLELHRKGMYLELAAYKCLVFLDFKIVFDTPEEPYARLYQFLGAKSVPDIAEALLELQFQALLTPFNELVNAGSFSWLIQNRWNDRGTPAAHTLEAITELEKKITIFFEAAASWMNENILDESQAVSKDSIFARAAGAAEEIAWILGLPSLTEKIPSNRNRLVRQALEKLQAGPGAKSELLKGSPFVWTVLIAYSIVRGLGLLEGESLASDRSRAYLSRWLLDKQIARTLLHLGLDDWNAARGARLVRLLLAWQDWFTAGLPAAGQAARFLKETVRDLETQRFLNINLYDGKLWFHKEYYEEMTWWLLALAAIAVREVPAKESSAFLGEAAAVIDLLIEAEARSGYQVEKLV
jgi:hypothetical protein